MAKLPEKQQEAWRELGSAVGAVSFVEGEKDMSLVKKVGNWKITLHTYVQEASSSYSATRRYTTMVAPYVCRDGFRFRVGHKGWFARLWRKLFGTKDVQVGYPEFDRDFFVKGNDEFKVRALFANPRIRELIQSQPAIFLAVRQAEPRTDSIQGVNALYTSLGSTWSDAGYVITDVERLKSVFALFEETLNQLSRIGSASEEKPDFKSMPVA